MTGAEMAAVAAAGFAAGGIDAVVGSGPLASFPVLLGVGPSPVPATTSNSLGLVGGDLTGAIGYRRELRGQGRLLLGLVPVSVLGGLTGAFPLLHLPDRVVWAAAGLLAAGSLVVGYVSSRYGRRLPEPLLRTAIVVLGVVAIGVLLDG